LLIRHAGALLFAGADIPIQSLPLNISTKATLATDVTSPEAATWPDEAAKWRLRNSDGQRRGNAPSAFHLLPNAVPFDVASWTGIIKPFVFEHAMES